MISILVPHLLAHMGKGFPAAFISIYMAFISLYPLVCIQINSLDFFAVQWQSELIICLLQQHIHLHSSNIRTLLPN